jgi:hypothetical protein
MRRVVTTLAALSLSAAAMAYDGAIKDGCEVNVDLKHDMKVSPDQVLVYEDEMTLYTLKKDGRLWVGASEIQLDVEQKRMVSEYANGVSALVPKIFAIVSTALEVAGTALNTAFTELFGVESTIAVNSEELMHSAQRRFESVVQRNGDTYTIEGGNIGGIHDAFGEEFENEVEELMLASMGSVFALVGKAMFSNDGAFKDRMEQFGENMADWEAQIDADMEAMGADLAVAGEELCQDMVQLSAMEKSLRAEVPELATFELFTPDYIRAR